MDRQVIRTKNFAAAAADFILAQAHQALGERNNSGLRSPEGTLPFRFIPALPQSAMICRGS
jgi:hypothetical protein